jgi:hypothetical protein
LDSLEGGKFLIANPEESWSAGCTRLDKEPDKQLILEFISVDTLKIKFWQGGIVKRECNMVLLLKGEKVQASYNNFL